MSKNQKIRKWILVAGARPNFIKIASLYKEIRRHKYIKPLLIHTGQHYSDKMSKIFFNELAIPKPDIDLAVGSGSHAFQTAEIIKRFEAVVVKQKPELVTVVGDVNSTLACALTAVKLGVKVAHVEAGLRSFDRSMPEEINRILTDSISDFLFVTEKSGLINLKKEGIDKAKVYLVGNTMIDTLKSYILKAKKRKIIDKFNMRKKKYILLTLHRPSNVDEIYVLDGILKVLKGISKEIPVVFPVHPRTVVQLNRSKLCLAGIQTINPLGYLDFVNLMMNARLVLTDSGGIQEETTILGIPCLTLRKNTERPITIKKGTNKLVGNDPCIVLKEIRKTLTKDSIKQTSIRYWDGKASKRIVSILLQTLT